MKGFVQELVKRQISGKGWNNVLYFHVQTNMLHCLVQEWLECGQYKVLNFVLKISV
jgi:hypothetical protein